MKTPQEILEMLGFTYVTGNLWRKEGIGIVVFPNPMTTSDIVQVVYKRGYTACQAEIRAALGIKPTE